MDVAGLVYAVSRDLYAYYAKAKERDNDLNQFRAQILSMHEKSCLVKEVLQRPGVQAENKSKAEDALRKCELAAKELRNTAAKFEPVNRQNQDAVAKLKARFTSFGRKTVWPLKKETIEALSSRLATCHDALGDAIPILHLAVGVSHVERLERLDKEITDGKISMESALESIRKATDKVFQDVLQQLAQQKQMLTNEKNRMEAEKIVQSLRYDQIESREHQIDNQAHNATYSWLFAPEGQEIQEVKDLVQFLNTGTGLFWISGDAASGKSTLMKYIASPRRGGQNLWTWEGSQDVTIACHFCWIADDFQKTQSALLRTLLYHILQAELEIASEVRVTVWGTGSIREPWSVAQLWDSLRAAVKLSKNRICIFIDGLDELQPETDHRELAENLRDLSRYEDIKLVVSSRPWPVFEGLNMKSNTLQISLVNNKAIIDYLRATLSHLEKLSEVCWTCLKKRDRTVHHWWHQEVESQRFVQGLLHKIDGNFLLASFMVSSICSHLECGRSLASVRQVIDEKSNTLEVYVRNMIYERIDSNLISEAAMAIKIALIQGIQRSWVSFWILLASLNGEIPSMLDEEYVFKMPCLSWDKDKTDAMFLNTNKFLDRCCRDILAVSDSRSVDFKHRSIFEFVHTPEIQRLLDEHTPGAFRDNFFEFRLAIAQAKVRPRNWIDDDRIRRTWQIWMSLGFAFSRARKEVQLMCHISPKGTILRTLAREAENVVIECMPESSDFWPGLEMRPGPESDPSPSMLRHLCLLFASCGLYLLTETVMARGPQFLVPPVWDLEHDRSFPDRRPKHNLLFFALGLDPYDPSRKINTDLLRRLLDVDTGVDPNRAYVCFAEANQWSTPWCLFLQYLERNQNFPTRAEKQESKVSEHRYHEPESFDSPHAQTAIKMLLEAGAELKLSKYERFDGKYIDVRVDPSATLKRWLTKEQLSKLGVAFAEQ